ncbi:MAG: hypothetical protein IJW00_01275 [Clostridia bacterium]|nr:hypothetical protein [Clostridia bacterium]
MKKFLSLLLAAMMVLSCFAGMTFTISAEDTPEAAVEDLVIDIASLAEAVEFAPAGYTGKVLQFMNYGHSVKLGDIDLSKYSSAVITYGCDGGAKLGDVGSQLVLTKNGPVSNADNSDKADVEIIASGALTNPEIAWAAGSRKCEIALDTDYNGPVYLCHLMKSGDGIAVDSIKFVSKGNEQPVYEEKTISLGLGDQGGPFSGAPQYNFGQRYNIGDDVLSNVSIIAMATYADGDINKWNFKVWQWDTDYGTTVAGTPLFDQNGENHKDNQTFSIDIPTELNIRGDIYYEITYVEGPSADKAFTGWTASGGPAEGVETYVAGEQRTDGTYRAALKVIGLPLPPDPNEESTECLFAYDFSKYSENFTADQKVGSPNETVITELCNSGYVTLESKGGDPYFVLGNAPTVPASQSDYVVIKYRTSTANASGEIYTGRSDGLNWAAPMEKTHVDFTYVADGQWHTLIIDASNIWGDSKDANLTNFRFDFLKSAGSIDVSYIKFFATREGAEACVAAETKEVTLSGEYVDGDDAIIIVGGGAYSADKWVKLSNGGSAATQSFAGDPANMQVCADEVRSTTAGELTKYCTQEAHLYIASINGKIVDAEGAYDSISFRGWANPKTDANIVEYGYAINNQEPVFKAEFLLDEPPLKANPGLERAERFENIEIPTADLANGVYNIYLLVKDTNGVIYCMNSSFGGDIQYVKGNATTSEYPYVDAEGNGYTVRADGVLFDANGLDTGMHLFVDDEGTPYGAAHYFALEYQDPAAGAVEIDGVKYTYTTQVALTPKMDPVLPEDNSAAGTITETCGTMSPDTLFIDGKQINDGGSHEYIANVLGGKILDIDKTMSSFSLRGWSADLAGQQLVAEYGYQLNDQDPVFNAAWVNDGSDVNAVIGTTNASRYKIDIDVSTLADGIYNVYPLVKLADGTVQYLMVWGNIQFVKGGSWVQVGYTDGTNTYVKAEDGSVTVNGEAGTGKMLLTDTGAIYYDGVTELGEGAKGKYLYNVTLNYVVDPEIPVNPTELKPVYIVDGEALNPNGGVSCESEGYSYENGCITFVSTGGDPNSTANLVPAGTKIGRYMVVKYRTSTEGANGEVFVGASAGALGAKDNTRLPAYIADGEWHTLVADIGNVTDWPADGVVNHFRNDFLMSEGSLDVEYYAFFNTMKEATYYAENDCHVLPKAPVYYTITFKADGEVVKEISILEGTTSVKEPKVPAKEGYEGAWEEYTITGDADQTINAVYTKIGGETPEYKVDDPTKLTTFPEEVFKNYFTNPNQTEIVYNEDGSVTFKGTWTADMTNPMDPFVTFNYSSLMRKYVDNKLQNVPNKKGEYGVLVLKVKMDQSVAGNFLIHYAMGRGGVIDGTLNATPDIDAEGTGDYEYIIFDLSYTEFVDDVIGTIRFDWVDNNPSVSEENVGASMTLYEINLYKDIDEAMIACGMEVETDPPKDSDEETDPVTDPVATEPQATEPATTEPDDKGCKSVIASASALTVVAAACALVVLKKKKED